MGYIEFVDIPSVKKALAMDGEKLLGIPVMVQLTESEKNRMAEALAQQLQPQVLFININYVEKNQRKR